VDGVCVISHGSSSARAIVNAVQLAVDCVDGGFVDRMQAAIVDHDGAVRRPTPEVPDRQEAHAG
jgi:glycerol-3-phosphate acyltransferase PlsX